MRLIKIIVISLYTIILGFIVFGNTSVFADTITENKQQFVYSTTSGFDSYWINTQDKFDDEITRFSNKTGNSAFLNKWRSLSNSVPTFNYVVLPVSNVRAVMNLGYGSSDGDLRGYVVYIYNFVNSDGIITSNSDFTYATLNDYYGGFMADNSIAGYNEHMSFNAVRVPIFGVFGIYNYNNSYEYRGNDITPNIGASFSAYVPLSVYNYYHHIYFNYIDRNNTSGATQITSAINNQTNTLSNAIANQTQATKEQTNALLDTNDTGNETMSVNDTTTDTSADLGGLFNSINSAFTDTTSETQKRF